MNQKTIITGTVGFILGILVFGLFGYWSAPGVMIIEDRSSMGFEETVEAIKSAVLDKGWKVPTIHHIDKSVKKAGFDVLPVTVIELCQPTLAGKIIENDEGRVVTSMMPCRVSIYQTSDGGVVISRMNTGLVSKMFGGLVAETMADATKDTEIILGSVLQK